MPEWVDPLANDEAHQAWKARQARMETWKEVGRKATGALILGSEPITSAGIANDRLDDLVTCQDCQATFPYRYASEHELEVH